MPPINCPFPCFTRCGMVLVVRSFLATAVFSGIYNYLLYAQQVRSLSYLGGLTDSTAVYAEGVSLNQLLHVQATLAASKQLTGYIILIGIFITLLLIIWSVRGWFVERYAREVQPAAAPAISTACRRTGYALMSIRVN